MGMRRHLLLGLLVHRICLGRLSFRWGTMYVSRVKLAVALPSVLIVCAFLPTRFFNAQDSNDPSTFPEYHGVPQTPATPQGNSLATMQTSRAQGYHGYPTV